jgi:deoxyribodipyrimidine photo-lyase
VVWFRRDLRVADHPALAEAAGRGRVVCLFVLDPGVLGRRHHRAPPRLRFLRAGLEALDAALREIGGRLVVREGPADDVVPAVAAEAGADVVAITREVSPLGRARDARVARALASAGVELRERGGDLLVEPEAIPGRAGEGHLVFTPFWREWRAAPVPPHLPAPERLEGPALPSAGLGRLPRGDPPVPAGPAAARARLVEFIRSGALDAYGADRHRLDADATSRLSPYLRLGMCTSAQIGRAIGLPGGLPRPRGSFWRQVCWREFFHHHLRRHPEVARMALRPAWRSIAWDGSDEDLGAWERGETGYPAVDAGMRQLAAQGWIPNRARLIVASFLVRDLGVDWRRGETAFMRALVDGDPADNNGGWQWVAGTGTDAASYPRIMNPTLQGRRFDPGGAWVRRWVPELRDVPAEHLQEPWRMGDADQAAAGCRIGRDYPPPRVDHAERRRITLERYRAASP